MLSHTISFGDVAVIVTMATNVIYHYFASVRRADALEERQNQAEQKIDDLRHGRGLVLGPTSDWPPTVRRCFGYADRLNGN